MQSKFKIVFIIFLISSSAFSQIENLKWGKADFSYENPSVRPHREYKSDTNSPGQFITNSLANAYWFFISDVDGDRCPFRPTCSAFLVQSIEETDLFQASLMFFDRLTRDLNFAKGNNHYPKIRPGYYFDPPNNYTLKLESIEYLPPVFIFEDE